MKSICLIIPYFGEFPSYFQLFLNSCGKNQKIKWLLITDNDKPYNYPDNVSLISMSFSELKAYIQKKFEFPISLERPYKLCDYKPAYGFIFQDLVREYDYWGHCDVDVIFGDLEGVLEKRLDDYDKLFEFGHFTLYKNTDKINRQFMSLYNGECLYKKVYSVDTSCIFDELYSNSINNIFIQNGLKILKENISADIYTKSSDFLLTYYNEKNKGYRVEKCRNAVFTYEEGRIFQYKKKRKEIVKQEFAYIHLQKRKMQVKISDDNAKCFMIIPNAFEDYRYNITLENWRRIKKKNFNLHYFQIRFKNLTIKIKRCLRRD